MTIGERIEALEKENAALKRELKINTNTSEWSINKDLQSVNSLTVSKSNDCTVSEFTDTTVSEFTYQERNNIKKYIKKCSCASLWLQDYKTLKDKSTPKSPYFEGDGVGDNGNIIYDNWICPCCDSEYETKCEEYDYCPSCGQAILWEDKQ